MADTKGFDVENLGDELIDRVIPAKEFVQKNTKTLMYAAGGIVVLLAAIFGYRFYINGKNNDAKNEMYKLQLMFEKDSFNIVLNGRAEQGGVTGIKSAQEIIDEFGGTKQANLAHYYAGVASMRTGKWDDAIEHLTKFDGSDDIVGALALGLIGDAYVEKGPDNYAEATKYYEKAAAYHSNTFTTPLFLMKSGGIYEMLKEYKKAVNNYELIKKDYPKSNEARDIDKFIFRAKLQAEPAN